MKENLILILILCWIWFKGSSADDCAVGSNQALNINNKVNKTRGRSDLHAVYLHPQEPFFASHRQQLRDDICGEQPRHHKHFLFQMFTISVTASSAVSSEDISSRLTSNGQTNRLFGMLLHKPCLLHPGLFWLVLTPLPGQTPEDKLQSVQSKSGWHMCMQQQQQQK